MKKNIVWSLLLIALPVLAQEPSSSLPLHVGIVLHASKNTFSQQQAAAADLVQKLLRSPGDQAFVVSAGGDKPWPYQRLDWANNPAELGKFIKSLDKNTGLPETFGFEIQTTSSPNFREWLTYYKGVPPETSIFAIAAQIMKADPTPSRRVLIMFRDPWDHSPGWSYSKGPFVEQRHNTVIEMLKEAGVSMYAIGIDEPSTRPRVPNDIGQNYGTIGFGSGGALRVVDQEVKKSMDQLTAAGRQNLERLCTSTGGVAVYGTKKNYADAVTVLGDKLTAVSPVAGK